MCILDVHDEQQIEDIQGCNTQGNVSMGMSLGYILVTVGDSPCYLTIAETHSHIPSEDEQ